VLPESAAGPGRRFDLLAEVIRRDTGKAVSGLPPFQGGVAGLFGYGLARAFERIARCPADEFALPDFAVGVYRWVLAFDHRAGSNWLFARGPDAETHLRRIRALVRGQPRPAPAIVSSPVIPSRSFPVPGLEGVSSSFSRPAFEAVVRRAVEYIHAGDCFQVNLAQRLLHPALDHPLNLYRRLRERNPAPFAAYLDCGPFQVLSASPERFVRVDPCGTVSTRPIKGTRPRGKTPATDAALAADLAASPKDRAENVMIVDLLRNDLGRVCAFGTVRVTEVCSVETYRTVHHLVSEVVGRLRPGLDAVDLLRAAFPGGSVTGAPKVRAMEIIAELEGTERGPYCGSIGYIGLDGAADTSILIRTVTAAGGWWQFPVGGGIVADSDPVLEYEETLHKAAGIVRALQP
jgi:para-aminobenzoate synthetase component 1